MGRAHPDLKAPYGFLIGSGVAASARLAGELWKLRRAREGVHVEMARVLRRVGVRSRDAIVAVDCGDWSN